MPNPASISYSKDCRYYLAEADGPMSIRLIDGCHGTPEGVAEAATLHSKIFGNTGPWLMVEIYDVPEFNGKINEDDAALCRELVQEYTRND